MGQWLIFMLLYRFFFPFHTKGWTGGITFIIFSHLSFIVYLSNHLPKINLRCISNKSQLWPLLTNLRDFKLSSKSFTNPGHLLIQMVDPIYRAGTLLISEDCRPGIPPRDTLHPESLAFVTCHTTHRKNCTAAVIGKRHINPHCIREDSCIVLSFVKDPPRDAQLQLYAHPLPTAGTNTQPFLFIFCFKTLKLSKPRLNAFF